MQPRTMSGMIRHLRRKILLYESDGLTDGQLLEDYLARGEEAAFTALVRRHGPMVLGVCRRVLGNRHDAEDAFQATFLVMLRKASSIRPRQAVGPWLYGVAYHTARRAKTTQARRRAKERQLWGQARQETNSVRIAEDWRPLLDEELSRLPEKYRAPIVLCDLQGRTHKEAARVLDWPQGTLSGRLWRARALLAGRLTRRGLTLSTTVLTLAFAEDAACASMATPLVQATVKAGAARMGEVSASVVALTQVVLKAMWMTKVQMTMATVLAVSLGVGVFLYTAGARARPRAQKGVSAPPADFTTAPAPKAPDIPREQTPTARQLIATLNLNARRVQALRCTNLAIDVIQGGRSIGLGGMFVCQKPVEFRLEAKVLGQLAIDIGSNEKEAWYWFSHDDPPPLHRFPRRDITLGKSRWPFPLQPEWFLEILGIVEQDLDKPREVIVKAETIELIEPIVTPQGQRARKVTLFARARCPFLAKEHRLEDARGETICWAKVRQVREDTKTNALLVHDVELSWPAHNFIGRLTMHNMVATAPMSKEQAARVFAPSDLPTARPSAVSFPRDKAKEELKPVPPVGSIQVDLTNTGLEMRCREEVMKVSGPPQSAISLRVLEDQLHTWAGEDKQNANVCITCTASVEYATLKAVLDACRQAGIRKIEVRAVNKSEDKAGGK